MHRWWSLLPSFCLSKGWRNNGRGRLASLRLVTLVSQPSLLADVTKEIAVWMGDNLRDISESFSSQQLEGWRGGVICVTSWPSGWRGEFGVRKVVLRAVAWRAVPCTSCLSQVGPCLPSPLSPLPPPPPPPHTPTVSLPPSPAPPLYSLASLSSATAVFPFSKKSVLEFGSSWGRGSWVGVGVVLWGDFCCCCVLFLCLFVWGGNGSFPCFS